MKTIWTIIKKELKRFFTDPRMLLGMFLPGILIFSIYSIMGDVMMDVTSPKIEEFNLVVENNPEELSSLLQVEGWTINLKDEYETKEEILDALKNKEIDLYISYEEDFFSKMLEYDSSSLTKAPQVEIYYNSTSDGSGIFYQYYVAALTSIESQLTNKFDVNSNMDVVYDVATEDDVTIYLISMMIPFLLITFLFTGCMSICSESIAGEKERGTIATLLITPTKRSHIVFGKVMALGITGLASSCCSFVGLLLSLPKLMGSEFNFEVYGFGTIILMLLLIFVTVLLFTTLLTIISTFAKSVKEASSYSAPLMIVVMLVGITNFMSTSSSTSLVSYAIPVYNIMQCLVEVFSLNINVAHFVICICSNIVYIGLGIFIITKMFNNEKIIFNM